MLYTSTVFATDLSSYPFVSEAVPDSMRRVLAADWDLDKSRLSWLVSQQIDKMVPLRASFTYFDDARAALLTAGSTPAKAG